MTFTGSSVLK